MAMNEKTPGMIPGHRPPAPEKVEKPVLFDPPGWQAGGPAERPFDLNLDLGENSASMVTQNISQKAGHGMPQPPRAAGSAVVACRPSRPPPNSSAGGETTSAGAAGSEAPRELCGPA
jgi:hypothetical protein